MLPVLVSIDGSANCPAQNPDETNSGVQDHDELEMIRDKTSIDFGRLETGAG